MFKTVRPPILPVLVLLALTLMPLWTVTLHAEWAALSSCEGTSSGDDQTLTLGCTPATGQYVVLLVTGADETTTFSITGSTLTWVALTNHIDSAGFSLRTKFFCAQGDGVDSTYVVTTSDSTSALAFAKGFSGGTCTVDGAVQSNDDANTPENLTTNVTSASNCSLLLGSIRSTSAANFDPGTNMTQFGTDALTGSAEFRILTVAGANDTPWTSAANENALLVALSVSAASCAADATTGKFRTLMGVGDAP